MNSEVPQVPESDRQDFLNELDHSENIETVEFESTSKPANLVDEISNDVWAHETVPPIDVEPEAINDRETKFKSEELSSVVADNLNIKEESADWLEPELTDNKVEMSPVNPLQSDTEAISKIVDTGIEVKQESTELNSEQLSETTKSNLTSDISLIESPEKNQVDESLTKETEVESVLFAEQWLDEAIEAKSNLETEKPNQSSLELEELEAQKEALIAEIQTLTAQKEELIRHQSQDIQATIGKMVEEGMRELQERKNALQIEIDKLERRQERIRQEMRTNFAGASQELAVRVQGFKDYLVGSLQDLAVAADKLELSRLETTTPTIKETRERQDRSSRRDSRQSQDQARSISPQFTEQAFASQTRRIRQIIDTYRNRPDYYGAPWKLRRTFEPIHADRVQQWFFTQGGRGAIDSLNSRLQNILVASAVISILHSLYGTRFRTLVLIDTPEKLGEWRKGLQDCLGISRSDFGSSRGVVLFDSADVLSQRAERLMKDKLLPFILIDETEELINLSLLKFPLWLAFAAQAKSSSPNYLY